MLLARVLPVPVKIHPVVRANSLDGSAAWQYKRTVGGKEVCADGNATDNWDTPPAGGWGYHSKYVACVKLWQPSECMLSLVHAS